MAWNEPGGGNKRPNDPWGNGNKNQGPPDLDEWLSQFFDKLSRLFGGGGNGGNGNDSSKVLFPLILVVALIAYGLWGFETITEGNKGVVQQFGQFHDIAEPGPKFVWKPIQSMTIVDVQALRKVDNERSRQGEREMLTKDENIVIVKYVVQYRIDDARSYLFNVYDPEGTLREASESAIREIIGRNTLDDITTQKRNQVAQQAKGQTQEIINSYDAGVIIQSVSLTEAQFPSEVQAAIDDVTKAREDKERYINEAEAYANQVLPEAEGQAVKLVEEAKGYKVRVEESAKGEASRFNQLLTEYRKAPQVTRDRLYLDAQEEVLGKSSKVVVDTDSGNNLLYLPLDKMVQNQPAMKQALTAPIIQERAAETKAAPAARNRSRNTYRQREIR